MKKAAVLVGINYYSVPGARLNGCINDINNISQVMTRHFNYESENITKLHDNTTNPELIPNRTNILTNLTKLINNSTSYSEIWFHYSGHGSQIRDLNRDESDGLDEVIVPLDYQTSGFITDDELFQIIRLSRCKTILVFDSCHSASMCDLQWKFEHVTRNMFRKSSASNKSIPYPHIFCFSGCKDNQTSADTYSNVLKQGVGAYTDSMIHCLTVSKMNINALILHANICAYIKSNGFTQTPMFSSSSPAPFCNFVSTASVIKMNSVISPSSTPAKKSTPDTKSQINMKSIFSFETLPNISDKSLNDLADSMQLDLTKRNTTRRISMVW
jgi:hypothetical protein